jgi:hypothetical protein
VDAVQVEPESTETKICPALPSLVMPAANSLVPSADDATADQTPKGALAGIQLAPELEDTKMGALTFP